ncbi:TolC family protein [soil metagenome]
MKLRSSFVLLFAASSIFSRTASAQEGPLRLEDVTTSTDRSYPALRAALRESAIADAELRSANGAFDPSWRTSVNVDPVGYYKEFRVSSEVQIPTPLWGTSFWAGWGYGDNDFPVYYGNYVTNSAGEARIGASIPFWRNGPIDRRRANIDRAELGRTLATVSIDQQKIEIRRAATLRYWDWVAAGRRRAIAEALLEIAVSRDAAIGARVGQGDLPQIERTDNSRAIVQRQGFVISAQRDVERAAIELSMFVRDESGNPRIVAASRLPDALPEPISLDAGAVRRDATAAQQKRPEVRRYVLQQEQTEIERRWAANQMAPAIDFRVLGSSDLGRNPDPFNLNRNRPELQLGLVIDIPLLNRANDGRVKVAESQIARLEDQKRLMQDRVGAEVSDALSALEAARQRVLVARREVTLAAELEVAERQRFDLGDSTLLVVNLREQASAESRMREIDAMVDFQRALASYRASTMTQPR